MASTFKIDREHLKPLPVGNSGWAEFSQTCYTVDKTLLIKDLIDDMTTVARTQLAQAMGVSSATVARHLKSLQDAGELVRIGSRKTGYWEER